MWIFFHRDVVLCMVIILLVVSTVKCVTITTNVPKTFEVGKSATIECDVVYNDTENFRYTSLKYLNDTGILKIIEYAIDNKIIHKSNPMKDRINFTIENHQFKIRFKEFRYNDDFIFVLEAVGSHQDSNDRFLNIQIKNVTIKVDNVQGGVSNCGYPPIQTSYQLQERNGTQSIIITLCGNPLPRLLYSANYDVVNFTVKKTLVDSSKMMYKFELEFEDVNRELCGTEIRFNVTGFKPLIFTSKIFVEHRRGPLENFVEFIATRNNMTEAFEQRKCLHFKFTPSPKPFDCQYQYTVYAYNSTMDLVNLFTNITMDEKRICEQINGSFNFDDILYVKSEVSWMGLRSELSDVLAIVDHHELFQEEYDENDDDVVYLTDPLAIAGLLFVILLCVEIVVMAVCCFKRLRGARRHRKKKRRQYTDNETDNIRDPNELYETADGRQDSDYDYPYTHFKKPLPSAKRRQNNNRSNSNFPTAGTVTLLNVRPYESEYENADDINEYMEIID